MFSISAKVRYALRSLARLAEAYEPDGVSPPVSLHRIADSEGISRKYLEQIFGSLKNAGLVAGNRGPDGGYALLRKPEEVTLYDVVTALEGPVITAECGKHSDECVRAETCASRAMWEELQDVTVSFLKAKTLKRQEYEQTKSVHG